MCCNWPWWLKLVEADIKKSVIVDTKVYEIKPKTYTVG